MKTYKFIAGWLSADRGLFENPVRWRKADKTLKVVFSFSYLKANPTTYQFVERATRAAGDGRRSLLLVQDTGEMVRANVEDVLLGEKLTICVEPVPDQ